jgi:exodeoxyribonuclease V beta subunit
MKDVEHFDLLNSPLAGTNLVEASAGTGKTYTIAGLFLRLLVEKNLSVDEILVVTFTEAAAGELKDRIRDKLREATEAFTSGGSDDTFLNGLIQRHRDSASSLQCLREAINAFDLASIFTIHGFCLRMLHENAFESGTLFDTELIADQEHLKRQIVEDFWRRQFHNGSPLFIKYAMDNKCTPGHLLILLGNKVTQPYLNIIPEFEIADSSQQELDYQECFNQAREAWQAARGEVKGILTSYEGLNRNKYRKTNIPVWIYGMDQYLVSGGSNATLFKGFDKFTSSELAVSVKGGHSPPVHQFFELCDQLREKQQELAEIFEQRLLSLKSELFHYVRNELARRKDERNVQSFEDLLVKLERALLGEGGEELARAIRTKFKAALIDEFQDTDPVQYNIFREVFSKEDSILFLIGDPKQAIYGFRGADIFAYMDAAGHVERRYTLGENWRSEPHLVTAINAIFGNADTPFVYKDIEFHLAIPAERQDTEFLELDGESEQALQLWFLDAGKIGEPGKPIAKGKARELIPQGVAVEISRLLSLSRNNMALLGEEPLKESDIAVLVRTNAEARLMQQALSAFNIPSVLHSTESLFDSHEAMEMERVLTAIAEPHTEKFIKAALATDMIGASGEEIDRLLEDDTEWDRWLVRFRDYHELWKEQGFMVMFHHLLSELSALTRPISFPDGERRNTNILHLAEVIHQASIDGKLGMSGLLKWLSEQRVADLRWAEEHQLRLESDETAVRLVTIHKSKGLEYPVVFCPFTWDGSRLRSSTDPFIFHDEAASMRLTLDLGSPKKDKHKVLAEKELLAENLRLLYVALTRARNRCYLVWGRLKQGETSALAYLIHHPEPQAQNDVLDATALRFKGLSDRDLLSELATLQDKANGTIRLSAMPEGSGAEYSPLPVARPRLSCRRFSGHIDRQWQISSFSALISGKAYHAELGDRDPIIPDDLKRVAEVMGEVEPTGIFSFPKGTKAGTFLHDVFENLDFAQSDTSAMEKLVADKLKEYGFEIKWLGTICTMIQKVLSAPLQKGKDDFTLSQIKDEERLNELEFYFPLKSISPRELKRLFVEHAGPKLRSDFPERFDRLEFVPVKGFMKGFIDMVFQFKSRFYILDWKSNFLGSRVEDYGQDTLNAVMEDDFYVLQYHIYSLALNQYLNARLPGYNYETHFGGVFYMFLRGIDPARSPDYGVYWDRPPRELIEALRRQLIPQT